MQGIRDRDRLEYARRSQYLNGYPSVDVLFDACEGIVGQSGGGMGLMHSMG